MAINILGLNVNGTAKNTSLNHTLLSGSYRLVLVMGSYYDADGDKSITGATYGGVAMTQLASVAEAPAAGSCGTKIYGLWEDDLPANGVNSVVVTRTAANWVFNCVAFSGVKQTGTEVDEDTLTGTGIPDQADLTVNYKNSLYVISNLIMTISGIACTGGESGGESYTFLADNVNIGTVDDDHSSLYLIGQDEGTNTHELNFSAVPDNNLDTIFLAFHPQFIGGTQIWY